MKRRRVAAAALTMLLGIVALNSPARADQTPTCRGPLTPDESAFVAQATANLTSRFAHVRDALAAGYVRYTAPDDTGAISYANDRWTSEPTRPSQLFYDVDGNLLGADFSVPRAISRGRPNLWGINPCRWFEFNGHVHYVARDPKSGKMIYDQWVWNRDFVKSGGSLSDPSAKTLVRLGRVPNASDVVTIFELPSIWDLIVWVKPHQPNQLFW